MKHHLHWNCETKQFLPTVAKSTENRQRGNSKHFSSEDITLCSFWDKGKGPVDVLSSMHGAQCNLDAENGKSDIVKFYNKTKSGVDALESSR